MIHHLFDLEAVTLAVGIVGAWLSIWGLFSACADLNYLTAKNLNGARRIVAISNISRQSFRMAIQVAIVGAGSYAVIRLDFSHGEHALVLLSFILMIGALTLVSEVLDRIRRVQLEHLYDRTVAEEARRGRRKTDATLAAVCRHEGPGGAKVD